MRRVVSGIVVAVAAFALAVGSVWGTEDPAERDEPDLERGGRLYEASCAGCHGGETGGSITDVPPPHNANGHTWHHPDCELMEIVLHGSDETVEMMREMRGVPESIPLMPAFGGVLDEGEIWDILSHIETWWSDDQRRQQALLTRSLC